MSSLSGTPRPPTSTLFPYTTLFRSQPQALRTNHQELDSARSRKGHARFGGHGGESRMPFSGSRDRKSTRLNSSHLGISYAVFCLKKKNDLSVRIRHPAPPKLLFPPL